MLAEQIAWLSELDQTRANERWLRSTHLDLPIVPPLPLSHHSTAIIALSLLLLQSPRRGLNRRVVPHVPLSLRSPHAMESSVGGTSTMSEVVSLPFTWFVHAPRQSITWVLFALRRSAQSTTP